MSFFSTIPLWGWFDIGFNLTVLTALCGEMNWALKRLIPKNPESVPSVEWRRKKLKKRFEWLLIFGIAGEVACLPFSLWESSVLNAEAADARKIAGIAEKQAGDAWTLAENIGTTNLVLQTNVLALKATVLELEARSRWRTITPDDTKRFIELTKNIFKFPVRIRMGNNAPTEVQSFGKMLRGMLDAGGFKETNADMALGEWPPELNLLYNGGGGGELPSVTFLNYLSVTSNIIALGNANATLRHLGFSTNATVGARLFLVNTDSEQTAFISIENGKPVYNLPIPSPGGMRFTAFLNLQSVFNDMGITTGWMTTTNITKGVCEVFINPR